MKRTWIYLINTFLVVTKNSYLLAQKIAQYHLNALTLEKNNAFFTPLYNIFKPLIDSFETAFTDWKKAEAVQLGCSQSFYEILDDLISNQVASWDIDIQVLYKQRTANYKKLMPRQRIPFQKGAHLQRLQAVKNLSTALADEPKLAAVKTNVDAFLAKFEQVLDTQKQSIQHTEKVKNVLEALRIQVCVELYRNLGLLMAKYAETPESAANYFPLPFLRQSAQVSFTNSVKPQKTRFIAKRTLKGSDSISIFNTGNTPLTLYFAQTKGDTPGTTAFTIQGNDIQLITADQMGDVSLKLIMVHNPDATSIGNYQFDIN